MKTIISMLVATILALYTFCTSCWYAPSLIFGSVMPFVFVALFAHLLTVYVVYRHRHWAQV
jgi:positive regulator of sigma E activity